MVFQNYFGDPYSMPTPEEKRAELVAELKEVVDAHNEANQAVLNAKQKIAQLQGGIAALDSLNEDTEE